MTKYLNNDHIIRPSDPESYLNAGIERLAGYGLSTRDGGGGGFSQVRDLISAASEIDMFWAIDANFVQAEVVDVQAWYDSTEASPTEMGQVDYKVEDGVAIVPIVGPLTKDPTCASYLYGGTSTIMARKALRKAFNDPAVKGIMMNVDSPGGQVDGTNEFAKEVQRIANSGTKQIWAYNNGDMCSAAYWGSMYANRLVGGEMADTGSIGVLTALRDTSEAAKANGVKVHVVKYGEHKGIGTPGTKITPAQLAVIQAKVDAIGNKFVAAVQDARPKLNAAELATGETWLGEEAVANGLLDEVATYEDTLAKFQSVCAKPTTTYSSSQRGNTNRMANNTSITQRVLAALSGDEDVTATEVAQPTYVQRLIGNAEPNTANAQMLEVLTAQGITDVAKLQKTLNLAAQGTKALTTARANALKEAIRASADPTKAEALVGGLSSVDDLDTINASINMYKTHADTFFAIGIDGGTRTTQVQPTPDSAATTSSTSAETDTTADIKTLMGQTSLGRAALAAGRNGN